MHIAVDTAKCAEGFKKAVDRQFGETHVAPPLVAGWSSLVARQAHNLKVAGSNPAPAPNFRLRLTIPLSGIAGTAFRWDPAPAPNF